MSRKSIFAFGAALMMATTPAVAAEVGATGAAGFAIEIDGASAGYAQAFSGGHLTGTVAEEDAGPSVYKRKHISNLTHEPFTVELDPASLAPAFAKWIDDATEGSAPRHTMEAGGRVFEDALISEVTIPALDGSSKDPAYFTVKIDPEILRYEEGGWSQGDFSGDGDVGGTAHKKWLASNWRFEMGSLPTSRVSKIDSFTIKQTVVKDEVGAFREPTKHPGKVEVPNLKITFSAADAEAWADWHRRFLIEGYQSEELEGAIVLLGPDGETELGTIELIGVGLVSLAPSKLSANSHEPPSVEAELYVEEMKISFDVADR